MGRVVGKENGITRKGVGDTANNGREEVDYGEK